MTNARPTQGEGVAPCGKYAGGVPRLGIALACCRPAGHDGECDPYPDGGATQGEGVIVTTPGVLSGAPCFAGTRIPVDAILDLLGSGVVPARIISKWFPDLSTEQVAAAVQYARDAVDALATLTASRDSWQRAAIEARELLTACIPVLVEAAAVAENDGMAVTGLDEVLEQARALVGGSLLPESDAAIRETIAAETRKACADWQPIETAPRNDLPVQVLALPYGAVTARRYRPAGERSLLSDDGWSTVPGHYSVHPTHWMPLPEPPPPDTAETVSAPAPGEGKEG